MNHQPEEHFHTNNDVIDHNTRRNKRGTEDAIPPSPNQASNSSTSPHMSMMSAQPKIAPQQKQETNKGKSTEPQVAHLQSSVHLAPKALTKVVSTPLNVENQMKKIMINISM